jgi:hypothetical protein
LIPAKAEVRVKAEQYKTPKSSACVLHMVTLDKAEMKDILEIMDLKNW